MAKRPSPKSLPRGISALGITERHEMLLIMPTGCHDFVRAQVYGDGHWCCTPAQIISSAEKHPDRQMWSFRIGTEDGVYLKVSLFGPHPTRLRDWSDFHEGLDIIVAGEVREFGRELTLTRAMRVPEHLFGRVVPTYKSVPKVITGQRLQESIAPLLGEPDTVALAVSTLTKRLGPVVCQDLAAEVGMSAQDALESLLWHLHRPERPLHHAHALGLAKQLSVDAILTQSGAEQRPQPASAVPIDWFALQALKDTLPFPLSPSQDEAIEAIIEGLEAQTPLNVLLSGDVGSGKTLTYALPAVAAQQVGCRVAILTPNTPLASQIASELKTRFTAVPSFLLTGTVSEDHVRAALIENAILVGTTSILGVATRHQWQADLLVVDEQQKFSIEQKQALAHPATNVIEATATCIPRTLGMLKHGGQQLIQLHAHSTKDIKTKILGVKDKDEIVDALYDAVEAGDRAFLIYPQVATDEANFRRNVISAAEKWERYWPGRIACLHGGLKDAEKKAVLDTVLSGEKCIVVATSILEVGISIPRLRVGVVISAERYGLSTLHQMRGRLAREGGSGQFFLYLPFDANGFDITDEQIEMVKRLRPMEHTHDGFQLAERDAARRGFGNLLDPTGTQHGKTATAFFGLNLTPNDFLEGTHKHVA